MLILDDGLKNILNTRLPSPIDESWIRNNLSRRFTALDGKTSKYWAPQKPAGQRGLDRSCSISKKRKNARLHTVSLPGLRLHLPWLTLCSFKPRRNHFWPRSLLWRLVCQHIAGLFGHTGPPHHDCFWNHLWVYQYSPPVGTSVSLSLEKTPES